MWAPADIHRPPAFAVPTLHLRSLSKRCQGRTAPAGLALRRMDCLSSAAETSAVVAPSTDSVSPADVTAEAVASHSGVASTGGMRAAAGPGPASPHTLSIATRLVHPPKVQLTPCLRTCWSTFSCFQSTIVLNATLHVFCGNGFSFFARHCYCCLCKC